FAFVFTKLYKVATPFPHTPPRTAFKARVFLFKAASRAADGYLILSFAGTFGGLFAHGRAFLEPGLESAQSAPFNQCPLRSMCCHGPSLGRSDPATTNWKWRDRQLQARYPSRGVAG